MSKDKHKGVARRKYVAANCDGIITSGMNHPIRMTGVPGVARHKWWGTVSDIRRDVKKLIESGDVVLERHSTPKKFAKQKELLSRSSKTRLSTVKSPDEQPRMVPRGMNRPKHKKISNRKLQRIESE